MSDKEEVIDSAEEPEQEEGMGFLSHLEDLRKRIIWAVVGIVVGCIIAGVFINQLIEYVILAPFTDVAVKMGGEKFTLINTTTFGQPMLYFKIILISGVIISFPFMLYQFWKFVSPGLYSHERRWVSTITAFTSLCFFVGVSFAYFVMIPSMLNFAANFGTSQIENKIDIIKYLSFITTILLAAGLLFEMPMISYVLSRFGIITNKHMRKYRRHAIIAILILAAVLTPTPDPISQMIFAFPLLFLYELSIWIAKIAEKKYKKTLE